MFAILGLFGFAIASIILTGSETAEDDADTPTTVEETLSEEQSGFGTSPLSENGPLSDADTTLFTGDGDDVARTGAGQDYIDGEDGDDTLYGGAGVDELHGGKGDDTLFGGAGTDSLYGHVGDDTLFGGDHQDELIGGGGDDTLDGGAAADSLLGSFGDDTLTGGTGADVLFGGSGDDTLIGNDDEDADYLNGSADDDVLRGGKGDQLNGGAGADTFALDLDAAAYVEDYVAGEDIIEVAYDANGPAPTLSTLMTPDGLALLADGDLVAAFAGVEVLDLSQVSLVPV